jgi:hypothetical protein
MLLQDAETVGEVSRCGVFEDDRQVVRKLAGGELEPGTR